MWIGSEGQKVEGIEAEPAARRTVDCRDIASASSLDRQGEPFTTSLRGLPARREEGENAGDRKETERHPTLRLVKSTYLSVPKQGIEMMRSQSKIMGRNRGDELYTTGRFNSIKGCRSILAMQVQET